MIGQAVISQSVVGDYIALTKPRIVLLLVLTAVATMFLATGGVPDPGLVLTVIVAGTLASGGANALNHSLERDIDVRMGRTRGRPVAGGRVPPRSAFAYGVALNAVAFAAFTILVNPASAVLALAATLFYVLVYTLALKRTTPQNIVIGGAAGAMPPVVGWTAVTGQLELPALFLFAIIFIWTPPHFWSLALLIKDDYARAGIPMLPVVAGVAYTARSIFIYTLILLAVTMLFGVTDAVGWVYIVSATVLGLAFCWYAWRLVRDPTTRMARRAYLFSLLYLAALFVAIAVDGVVA